MQKVRSKSKVAPTLSLEQFKIETEKRAGEIFAERQATGKPGDSMSDWLQAEKEIKTKYHIA